MKKDKVLYDRLSMLLTDYEINPNNKDVYEFLQDFYNLSVEIQRNWDCINEE